MIEQSSVRVRLRRSSAEPGSATAVAVRWSAPFGDPGTWPTWDVDSIDIELPDHVMDGQTPDSLVDQVGDALEPVLRGAAGSLVLLTVEHDDLIGLAWERLRGPQVVRYAPTLAARAYEPVDTTLSIFFADVDDTDGRITVSSRYFRSVVASGQPRDRIETLVENGRFDVVHLGVHERAGSDPAILHGDGTAVDEGALARALGRTGARLLVLESRPSGVGPGSMTESLRTLAHRVHDEAGVAVLASGPADFRSFYFDLTHDSYLSDLVRVVTPSVPAPDQIPALWLRRGGDGGLRLLAASARLAADVIDEHQRVEAAQLAQPVEAEPPTGAPGAETATTDVLDRLALLRGRTYSFGQEALGVVPMAESRAELDELQRVRADRIPEPARVLNAWWRSDGRALPTSTSLATGSTYELAVTIGRPDRRSAVVEPASVEPDVPSAYVDGVADVTIVVSSTDVAVDRPRATLRLPLPPRDSDTVLFTVSTPPEPGRCRLRIGAYHRTNLLQSVLMTFTVSGQAERGEGPGYVAELEWALSSTFRNLDLMEEPALTIVSNEDPAGTHTFVAYGAGDGAAPDLHRQLDIQPGQLKVAVDGARNDLQNVCATFRKGKLDRYRFDRENRGPYRRLLEDLKPLALGGAELFGELTSGSDVEFNDRLESRLRGSRLIQVAAVKFANYVFPWSLVYDHDFIEGPRNVLCDVVGPVLEYGGSVDDLVGLPCFADECPHRHDPTVVCPAGFWGFRHRIEQPLLTAPAIEPIGDGDVPGGTPRHDVTTEIPLLGSQAPQVVVGVSETLADWSPHVDRIVATVGGYARPENSIEGVLDGLRRLDIHLAYFYCHGGRRGDKCFLGLGSRREVEQLFPQYLKTVRWPELHPFVFINGCRTVGVSPDDLLTFNKMFARARASGLLGTEIAVPEELAQHVADAFFAPFAQGVPVGDVVRRARLGLLARCNPLGLAYTPYCMAALRLSA